MNVQNEACPYPAGADVGYRGQRATVIVASIDTYRRGNEGVMIRLADGTTRWAAIRELGDPPPLRDEVQQAALDLAEFLLRGQHRSVFGGGS